MVVVGPGGGGVEGGGAGGRGWDAESCGIGHAAGRQRGASAETRFLRSHTRSAWCAQAGPCCGAPQAPKSSATDSAYDMKPIACARFEQTNGRANDRKEKRTLTKRPLT